MNYLEHSVDITSTPEKIWDILIDVENWKLWDNDVKQSYLHSAFAAGTKGTLIATDGNASTFFITAFKKYHYYSNYYQLPFFTRLHFIHKIKPMDNFCRVTFIAWFSGPFKWYFLFKQKKAILAVMKQAMKHLSVICSN